MEAFPQSFHHQQQVHQVQQVPQVHEVTQPGTADHVSAMQASPATVLTLKARMLVIAQFINAELSQLKSEECTIHR